MPRFFIDPPAPDGFVTLTGEAANHIARALRMKPGEHLTLCDGRGTDYDAALQSAAPGCVTAQVLAARPSAGEPNVRLLLFQGLPKGDKMDWIVQKAVELGAAEIVPFAAARSVSRPDDAAARKKTARWQKIADEAAGQSQRGILPPVRPLVSFGAALEQARACDRIFFCYEGGGSALDALLSEPFASAAIFIGPEGGFAPEEVAQAEQAGARRITLGPRILRTETAPLAALSAILFATGNM